MYCLDTTGEEFLFYSADTQVLNIEIFKCIDSDEYVNRLEREKIQCQSDEKIDEFIYNPGLYMEIIYFTYEFDIYSKTYTRMEERNEIEPGRDGFE